MYGEKVWGFQIRFRPNPTSPAKLYVFGHQGPWGRDILHGNDNTSSKKWRETARCRQACTHGNLRLGNASDASDESDRRLSVICSFAKCKPNPWATYQSRSREDT